MGDIKGKKDQGKSVSRPVGGHGRQKPQSDLCMKVTLAHMSQGLQSGEYVNKCAERETEQKNVCTVCRLARLDSRVPMYAFEGVEAMGKYSGAVCFPTLLLLDFQTFFLCLL